MYCQMFYNVVNATRAAIGPSQLHQTRLDTTLDFVLLLIVLHSFLLFLFCRHNVILYLVAKVR